MTAFVKIHGLIKSFSNHIIIKLLADIESQLTIKTRDILKDNLKRHWIGRYSNYHAGF